MDQFIIRKLIIVLSVLVSSVHGYNPVVIMDKNFLSDQNSYINVGLNALNSFNQKYNKKIPVLSSDTDKEEFLLQVAKSDYNPIISLSFLFSNEIKKISDQFPEKKFVIIDGNVADAKNILNVGFKEEEGSFLVGAIGALNSKTNSIGFIGGMDVPVLRGFGCGFIQGVKYINPKANIFVEMVGDDFRAFNNPKKAQEIAEDMIKNGVDVIFHAADRSGKGIIDAAKKQNIYAIGVDYNQNSEAPGHVLTSMLKRIDVALYKVLIDTLNDNLTTEDIELGLADQGVGWSLDKYNIDLIDKKALQRIDQIEFDIIHGMIEVEDYVKQNRCSLHNFDK